MQLIVCALALKACDGEVRYDYGAFSVVLFAHGFAKVRAENR